jgi:serine/threonine-protein kinase RsbW
LANDIPNVRLGLSNRAENVLLVRQTLSGLAETIDLDPVELNDVSTAVSEACNNVVVHAYAGGPGPLEVEIYASGPQLEVLVRDWGIGIQPREIGHEQLIGGIGLPVIRALTRDAEFKDMPGGGTEVRMLFDTAHAQALEFAAGERPTDLESVLPSASGSAGDTLTFTVGPPSLARAVLPRVLSALAARAYFSTDRISDTQMLADAIVAQAQGSLSASRVNVEVELQPRTLHLRIGPLRIGAGETVLHAATADELGAVLERLSDGHEISQQGTSETLQLRLAERR